MSLRQRRPRKRDTNYLRWLRTQRCACGCLRSPPSDAAHVRAASSKYDKPMTGFGAKPDDRWAVPLNHLHHMEQHATGEMKWWRSRGITDPWALCIDYYRRYQKEQQ